MHLLDFAHYYPRYGAAAAIVEHRRSLDDVATPEAAAALAADAIDRLLGRFFFEPFGDPTLAGTAEIKYKPLKERDLDPGKKSGQVAARGFFLAPHVVTADGPAASTVKAARGLRDTLRDGTDPLKAVDFTRSFAPLTSKINNGRASIGNPKASLLEAAFTAVATLTDLKPADWRSASGGSLSNHALIPDLPLVDGDRAPLVDFVEAFRLLRDAHQDRGGHTATLAPTEKPEKRGYKRPPVYHGNYPGAPNDPVLGPLSLLAAVGRLAREEEIIAGYSADEHVRALLDALADAPLYLVSYDGDRRVEAFGHHLIGFAQTEELGRAVDALGKIVPSGVDPAKRYSDPTAKLFRRAAARFVQTFERGAFRDFLAFRADYPATLAPILTAYMETHTPRDVVAAARVYGQSLNTAAFIAASEEVKADKEAGRKGRSLNEYKARVLVELESNARSAKTGAALLEQLGTVAGRLTRRDIYAEAAPFMDAVALGEEDGGISLDEAKSLVIAYMRLGTRSFKDRKKGTEDAGSEPDAPSDATDGPPGDAKPTVDSSDLFS